MIRTHRILPLALAFAAGTAGAQVAGGEKQEKQEKQPEPTWPELTPKQAARGIKWLKLLDSKKDETRQKAHATIVGLGAGMGGRLFRKLNDTPRNMNSRVVAVLDEILRPEHAAVVGLQATHHSVFARRYALKRLATWARPVSVKVFAAARKDKDVEVSYYAAIGLVKTEQDIDALDQVFERCEEEWDLIGDEVTRFLENSRSKKFIPWIHKKLASKEITEHIALLRIMRSIATADAKGLVRRFLDSEHAILKKEAINTLRVIVDGKKPIPLKKITVFQIIKLAKKWKARI